MEEIIVMVGYKPKEGMWEKFAEVCDFIPVSTIKKPRMYLQSLNHSTDE